MKKTLVFLAIIFTCTSSFGQDLKSYFLDLSQRTVGLSKIEIEQMISNFLNDKKGIDYGVGKARHYLTRYEPNNGFLSYTGAYEGSSSLTFWNVSDGTKLIAFSSNSCGPMCNQDITFFLKTKNYMMKLESNNVLPTITLSDFMDTEAMKKDGVDLTVANESFYMYDLLYQLPSKGKNIIVESQFQEVDLPNEWKKYDLGWEIEILWNDGTFVKK